MIGRSLFRNVSAVVLGTGAGLSTGEILSSSECEQPYHQSSFAHVDLSPNTVLVEREDTYSDMSGEVVDNNVSDDEGHVFTWPENKHLYPQPSVRNIILSAHPPSSSSRMINESELNVPNMRGGFGEGEIEDDDFLAMWMRESLMQMTSPTSPLLLSSSLLRREGDSASGNAMGESSLLRYAWEVLESEPLSREETSAVIEALAESHLRSSSGLQQTEALDFPSSSAAASMVHSGISPGSIAIQSLLEHLFPDNLHQNMDLEFVAILTHEVIDSVSEAMCARQRLRHSQNTGALMPPSNDVPLITLPPNAGNSSTAASVITPANEHLAATVIAWQELAQLAKCSLCRELCAVPHALSCGHCVCFTCYDDACHSFYNSGTKGKANKSKVSKSDSDNQVPAIACPDCNAIIPLLTITTGAGPRYELSFDRLICHDIVKHFITEAPNTHTPTTPSCATNVPIHAPGNLSISPALLSAIAGGTNVRPTKSCAFSDQVDVDLHQESLLTKNQITTLSNYPWPPLHSWLAKRKRYDEKQREMRLKDKLARNGTATKSMMDEEKLNELYRHILDNVIPVLTLIVTGIIVMARLKQLAHRGGTK